MALLSKKKIEELQMIIKRNYGRDISYENAMTLANNLVQYFDTLGKIYHKNKHRDKKFENLIAKN